MRESLSDSRGELKSEQRKSIKILGVEIFGIAVFFLTQTEEEPKYRNWPNC